MTSAGAQTFDVTSDSNGKGKPIRACECPWPLMANGGQDVVLWSDFFCGGGVCGCGMRVRESRKALGRNGKTNGRIWFGTVGKKLCFALDMYGECGIMTKPPR